MRHLADVMKAIVEILGLVEEIFSALRPCANEYDSNLMKELITKMHNANIQDIAVNVIVKQGQPYKDLIDLPVSFRQLNYHRYGNDLADFIYQEFQ